MLPILKLGEKLMVIIISSWYMPIFNFIWWYLTLNILMQDYAKYKASNAIKSFDVVYQLFWLWYVKIMADARALAIAKILDKGVKT